MYFLNRIKNAIILLSGYYTKKLIRNLKNAECSEDYFTPIYVFDVTSF
jgi:hypothetical protein